MSRYDTCVYLSGMNSNDMIILLIYVDDMLIASKCKYAIKRLKSKLSSEFDYNKGYAKRSFKDRPRGLSREVSVKISIWHNAN